MRRATMAFIGLFVSAGCLGGDGASEPSTTTGAPAAGADTATPPEATNASRPANVWRYDNRTGSVQSYSVMTYIVVNGAQEAFDVGEGALEIVVNVTADGELFGYVLPPTCATEDPVQELEQDILGCEDEIAFETTGGAATVDAGAPMPGEWLVQMYCGGAGTCTVPFELSFAQRLPADAAPQT